MLRDESVGVEATWCGVERESGHDERCATVHRRLKRIVKARGALDAQEAAALREAETLRLWRHYGYSSLLEYMEMEMGYTPRVALERLRVAKAVEELPVLAEKMEQGDLSFSALRELTRVATPETEETWAEAATDKNVRQIEGLVSGHKLGDKPTDPVDHKLRKRVLRYEVTEETVALARQAKQILERELGERLDDDALQRVYARMVIDGAAAPERTRAPYQIAVSTCPECKRGWQAGAGISVEMSPPALETALCDAQHIGSVDGDESEHPSSMSPTDASHDSSRQGRTKAEEEKVRNGRELAGDVAAPQEKATTQRAKVTRAKSDIPPALRRQVQARDQGACRAPWCRSSRNVDQHHIVPRSEGGEHTLENIISLCESHHIAHHSGSLLLEGTASNPTFTRRAHNSFAIAERAVETARALKDLGFDQREVKVAMEKTRTHVGTKEMTIQQWVKIALSYCPKPTS